MHARLKRLHSPDVRDLQTWSPVSDPFGFLLEAMINPSDGPGVESFTLAVCTRVVCIGTIDGVCDSKRAPHLVRHDVGLSRAPSLHRARFASFDSLALRNYISLT